DLVADNGLKPLPKIRDLANRGEEAVPYPIAGPEVGFVFRDLVIECRHLHPDVLNLVRGDAVAAKVRGKGLRLEAWIEREERKSATQGVIDQREGPIGGVHRADQVDVRRNGERLFAV